MPKFIVLEMPDGLDLHFETAIARELCRAHSLADLMNAIEDAEVRSAIARHKAANRAAATTPAAGPDGEPPFANVLDDIADVLAETGVGEADKPTILQFRRGPDGVARGAGPSVADADDAS